MASFDSTPRTQAVAPALGSPTPDLADAPSPAYCATDLAEVPDEVLLIILDRLSPLATLAAGAVSRSWRALAWDERRWQRRVTQLLAGKQYVGPQVKNRSFTRQGVTGEHPGILSSIHEAPPTPLQSPVQKSCALVAAIFRVAARRGAWCAGGGAFCVVVGSAGGGGAVGAPALLFGAAGRVPHGAVAGRSERAGLVHAVQGRRGAPTDGARPVVIRVGQCAPCAATPRWRPTAR